MITVYYTIAVKQFSKDKYDRLMADLPGADRQRISRYRRMQDRQALLIARHLLLHALIEKGRASDSLADINYNSYGKPYFRGDWAFNISHSGDCVVCALSDLGPIGIDVEKITDTDISSFRSWMAPSEWRVIIESENPLKEFFALWTKKEAVIKADGRGLSLPLESVAVNKKAAVVEGKTWNLHPIELGRAYICHMATTLVDCQTRLVPISVNALDTSIVGNKESASNSAA